SLENNRLIRNDRKIENVGVGWMQAVRSTITNGDVKLAVTTAGAGQKLIFFNGVSATQFIWKDVIRALGRRYQVVTFDFRNHGRSSAAGDHSFGAFLSDANA